MINIIVLIAPSGSGKSVIEKYLTEYFNYNKVISYTTRQMRDNEIDGVDYHFVGAKEFKELVDNNEFAEVIYYEGSDSWYAAHKNDINNNSVIVVTPEGFRQLKTKEKNGELNIKMLSFYIDVDVERRIVNMLRRGDKPIKVQQRISADENEFKGVESEVNVIFDNNQSLDRLKEQLVAFRTLYEVHKQGVVLENININLTGRR